jgi:hypothetical protein
MPIDDFIAFGSNESDAHDAIVEVALAAKVFKAEIDRIAAKYPPKEPA